MIFFITDEDDVMKRTLFQHAQKHLRYTTRQYSTAYTVDSFLNIIAVVYRSHLS